MKPRISHAMRLRQSPIVVGGLMLVSLALAVPARASELNAADYQIAIGDFSGDGKSDLLYIAKDPGRPSGIAIGGTSGGPNTDWQSWPSNFLGIPWHSGNYNPVVGDFNGDKRADLLLQSTTSGGWSYLLFTNTEGKFDTASVHQAVPDYCQGLYFSAPKHRIIAGNFAANGNGPGGVARHDLFLQGTARGGTHAIVKFTPISTAFGERAEITCGAGVVQSWGDGTAGFQWNLTQAMVYVGNFNGDTYDDLFVQAKPDWVMIDYEIPFPVPTYRPNSFGIVLASATGTIQSTAWQFWSRMQGSIDWSAANTNVAVADYNGDGRADILLQSKRAGGANYWFAANASGQISAGSASATLSNLPTGDVALAMAANFNGSTFGAGVYLQAVTANSGNGYTNSVSGGVTSHDYSSILPNNPSGDPTLINKATPGTAVGAIPGEFSVDPSGAAMYRIPIAVSPGVAGVAPDLALVYSSRGGNGLLGVGMTLSGLSAITLCGTTYEPDGQTDGADFDSSDQYCLDGQRLILVAGTHGAVNAEYRTEMESFQKVVLTSVGAGSEGASSFSVWDKAGLIREYGLAASPAGTDALIKAKNLSVIGPNLIWAVKRIHDRFDNFIELTYQQASNSTSYWPTSVSYGSKWNSSRAEVGRVDFIYTSRSDNSSGFLAGGYETTLTQRLQRIDVRGRANVTANSGANALVRQYFLNYELSTTSLLSHLKSVVLCDAGSGVNQRCFKDTRLQWQHGYRGFATSWTSSTVTASVMQYMKPADVDGDGRIDYIGGKSGNMWHVRRGRLDAPEEGFAYARNDAPSAIVMDWDSDGYQDLVQRSVNATTGGNYQVLHGAATGWGTNGQLRETTAIPAKGLSANTGATTVGDFDGDGKQDIAYVADYWGNGSKVGYQLDVHRNPASGFIVQSILLDTESEADGSAFAEDDASIRVLNFDNDGRDDIGVLVNNCWYTGGFHWDPRLAENVPNTTCTKQFQVYSMDPAGNLTKVFPAGSRAHQGMQVAKLKTLDANGDGLTDLLTYDTTVSGWRLYLGTGAPATAFAPGGWSAAALSANQCTETWTYFENFPEYQGCVTATYALTQTKLDEAVVFDYDRDGRSDVLFAEGGAGGVWSVLLGDNAGFKTTVLNTERTANQPDKAMVIDDRGDGIVDLLAPVSASGSAAFAILYGRGPFSGLVEKVTDGLGAQTFVQYATLTAIDPSNNQPVAYKGHTPFNETGAQPVFPYGHLAAPIPVVYQFAADNGLGPESGTHEMVRTTYEYRGLKVHKQGRGLLGFSEVRSWNDNSEIETGNRFAQKFPFTGMVLTSEQRFKSNAPPAGVPLNFNGQTILLDYASLCETTQICNNVNPGVNGSWTYSPGDSAYKTVSYTTNILSSRDRTYGAFKTYFLYVRKSNADVYPVQGGSPVSSTPYKRTITEYVSNSGATADGEYASGIHAYDQNGNPYAIRVTTTDGSGLDVHRITTVNTYTDDSANWCLGRLTATSATHEKPNLNGLPNAGPWILTRSASFAYQSGPQCVLQTENTEPADGSMRLTKTYAYDAYGNRYMETVGGAGIAPANERTTGAMQSDGSSSYLPTFGQFPVRTQNVLGHSETTDWDGRFGVALSTTGPNALTATSVIDTFGRKIKETPIVGLSAYSTQEFYWCGAIGCADSRSVYSVRSASSDGSESVAEFDRLGRQIHSRKRAYDGGWTYAEKFFDALGREYLASDPYNPATQSTRCWNFKSFDALGRPLKEWNSYSASDCTAAPLAPNATPWSSGGQLAETTYDLATSNGIATKVVSNVGDSSGYGTQRTAYKIVNVMGRTRFVRDDLTGTGCPSDGSALAGNSPSCLQTEYDYDAQGNLTYTRQRNSANSTTIETRVVFNTRGFKTSMSDPDMGAWSYGYNTFGELLSQTDANGQVTTLTYDKLGRMTTRAEGAEGTTTWTYDTASMGLGKLATVSAPGSYGETYSYDAYGRLERVRRQIGSSYFYIDQTYDSLGRVDTVKYPGSVNGDGSSGPEADTNRLRVRNNYNGFGYLASVQDAVAGTVYWQASVVDEAGRVTEEQLGNGLVTQRFYQRETGYLYQQLTGTSAGGSQIQDLQFAFDPAANLRIRKDRSPGVNGGAGLREQYQYDALYRLTQTAQYNDSTNAAMAATQNYSYDEFGNLLAKGTAYSNFTYAATRAGCTNTLNRPHAVYQVAAGATRQYCYDANGNLTSASNARYSGLTWWVSNLVKRVSISGSNYTEFTYGPDRARYQQYRYRAAGDTETTLYVGALYEKRTKVAGGTTTVEHTHYIRAGDQVIATAQRTLVGANPVGAYVYRYLHRDHLGSVTSITDAGGALIERSGFDPWGKRTDYSSWAPPVPAQFVPGGSGAGGTTYAVNSTKRGYTGHEQIDELGFIHMNGRIYDPEIGKFLSADPTMQFPESTQGFNRYAYAGNNPLTNVDPSGFSFWKKLMKIVGIVMSAWMPAFSMLWQKLLWTFAAGFLSGGGSIKAGLFAMVSFGFNSKFGSGSRSVPGGRGSDVRFDFGAASGGSPNDEGSSWSNKWIRVIRDVVKAATESDEPRAPRGKIENGASWQAFQSSVNPLAPLAGPFYVNELVTEIEGSTKLNDAQKHAALGRLRSALTVQSTLLTNASTAKLAGIFAPVSSASGSLLNTFRDVLVEDMKAQVDALRIREMRYLVSSASPSGKDVAGDLLSSAETTGAVGAVWSAANALDWMRSIAGGSSADLSRMSSMSIEICNGADYCNAGEYRVWLEYPMVKQ